MIIKIAQLIVCSSLLILPLFSCNQKYFKDIIAIEVRSKTAGSDDSYYIYY